jgi:hypothetical protein
MSFAREAIVQGVASSRNPTPSSSMSMCTSEASPRMWISAAVAPA